jgi:phage baseplate assembly protein W
VDASDVFGRGIAFPPRVGADGRVVWSDGDTNIRESIQVILKTERGERLRLRDFGAGLNAVLFEPNTTTTRRRIQDRIERALAAWEPRLRVESVEVEPDPSGDPESVLATIVYRLVATRTRERMTVSVQRAG